MVYKHICPVALHSVNVSGGPVLISPYSSLFPGRVSSSALCASSQHYFNTLVSYDTC